MTTNITCARCGRTTSADQLALGPDRWLRLSPLGQDVDAVAGLPGSVDPEAWTFCSSACLATWAADRVSGRAPESVSAAPAGLYLG
jgi:hypothetical protein